MSIITIANQKGGVGKSTTTQALAAGLAAKKRRVLIVDLDTQGNTSTTVRADLNAQTIYDVLIGEANAADAVQNVGKISIIPSARRLALADKTLIENGSEYLLREALAPLAKKYDDILIDTPPVLGILTSNALTAAYGVIIPACAEAYGLQGIAQLQKTINTAKKYTNKKLKVLGILLTRYRPTVLMHETEDLIRQLAAEMGSVVYKSKIRETTKLKEAQSKQRDIFDHAPNSIGAKDYADFTSEILAQMKKVQNADSKKR